MVWFDKRAGLVKWSDMNLNIAISCVHFSTSPSTVPCLLDTRGAAIGGKCLTFYPRRGMGGSTWVQSASGKGNFAKVCWEFDSNVGPSPYHSSLSRPNSGVGSKFIVQINIKTIFFFYFVFSLIQLHKKNPPISGSCWTIFDRHKEIFAVVWCSYCTGGTDINVLCLGGVCSLRSHSALRL